MTLLEVASTSNGMCTAQCKMLLFVWKPLWKSHTIFELKRKRKKNEKHFGYLATFWFGTFLMLFRATRYVADHQNTQRSMVHWHKGL